ncbi:MAG: glycosyltransferase [Gemmatimonadales bacterium]|nr:MAG: glycosyltransferase [Gemmatimonadales bacterium]
MIAQEMRRGNRSPGPQKARGSYRAYLLRVDCVDIRSSTRTASLFSDPEWREFQREVNMIGAVLILAGCMIGFYAFAGYPLLLLAARRLGDASPPGTVPPGSDTWLPKISISVPIFNEAHQLEELLASLVALDYPTDLRQILIVSDGSTDGSDEIVEAWADRGVELLRVEQRGGKGAAENSARPHLTGEIVVNTDASIRIRPGALHPLLRPFADPRVGVVSGRDLSVGQETADANQGEAGYVGYEMWVRDLETASGGIVGASGSLYATRRHLHEVDIPPELSRDFASALVAGDHGLAAVSVKGAVCLVPRTGSLRSEYRRKVRTIARGMTTLWTWRHLLNPLRHPGFAWKLWSHKICRWLLPVAILLIAAGLALVARQEALAWIPLAGGLGLVLAGATGWMVGWAGENGPLPRVLSTPAFFLMSNVAVVHAFFRAMGNGSQQFWEPTRRTTDEGFSSRSP